MTTSRRVSRFLLPLVLPWLAACNAPPPGADEIRTVLVHIATGAPSGGASFTGEVRARHEVELAFRVGGKIAARLADTGSEIRAGQPLARLDPNDLQLAATAAAAQVAAAESEVATSSAERERYAGLLARKFVSRAAFDSRQHALNAAQARLEQARAQSRMSSNQAAYGTLSAEFPAVVSAVLADVGQVVAAGQPVFRIARPEEKEVLIAVPESRVEEIRRAGKFTVNLWADPKTEIAGELRELGAVADAQTRTYPARIRLLAPPPQVRLGMTARVAPAESAGSGVLVPLSALGDRGDGAFVWVVADGKLARRAVRVAAFREDGALLGDGLHPGESVVIAGISRLQEGQAVHAKIAPPPAAQH